MSVVRSHTYRVDPSDVAQLLERRAALVSAIRARHAGLSAVKLIRLEDGSYTDTWYWDSAEQLAAALAAIPSFGEAPLAMALTRDGTAQNGVLVDEL
ncbi:hypothetical protein [Streptacidiphilus anmyonensis]|uniref:hypothetical protein n=1 Tax=Streptacidiphilus anmyonensis TaxID=405782 RepID=UPI0005A61FB8|nr:hypothetical protein [Streptacidiphilus anmyonensis]